MALERLLHELECCRFVTSAGDVAFEHFTRRDQLVWCVAAGAVSTQLFSTSRGNRECVAASMEDAPSCVDRLDEPQQPALLLPIER